MPIDFLNEDQPSRNMPNVSTDSPRDFLAENENKPESFGESATLAIPRMWSDLSGAAYNAAQAIPDYWNKAQTEIPALLNPFSEMKRNPIHTAGQGLAGVNEAINSAAQFPLAVSKYGSDRLNLIPKSVTNALQYMTPEDTTQSINNLFGEPKYAGQAAVRGAARNVLPISGVTKLVRTMPHLTQRGATRTLKKASSLAKERNIGTMDIDPELIKDARQFLPKTSPVRNTLKEAKGGDYNALFRLQSDLGKNASGYAKSFFSAAERSHGRAGLEVRNKLLDAIHENLQSQGHHDISKALRQGQNDYRRYMKFKPYRNTLGLAVLGKVLPKNALLSLVRKIVSH